MSLLAQLRQFLADVHRIREILETFVPKNDPRRTPHNLYRNRQ